MLYRLTLVERFYQVRTVTVDAADEEHAMELGIEGEDSWHEKVSKGELEFEEREVEEVELLNGQLVEGGEG